MRCRAGNVVERVVENVKLKIESYQRNVKG